MLDAAAVADWLKLPAATAAADAAALGKAAAAVVSYVDGLPSAPRISDPDDADTLIWAPETELAALMLAARLYRRRNSPAGVEAFGDQGTSYISRQDSDIARMLRIDAFAKPAVG